MKMLIVDDESFELELSKSNSVAKVVQLPGKGRQEGTKATPDSIRKLIASSSIEGSPAREVAQAFNVSESSVSAYKNGATSTTTYDRPAPGLSTFVNTKKEKISGKAQSRLLLALKHLTDEKLAEVKPIELSTIAANMSRVIEKMEPKEQVTVNNNIVFYSPKQISADNYDVLDVSPTER